MDRLVIAVVVASKIVGGDDMRGHGSRGACRFACFSYVWGHVTAGGVCLHGSAFYRFLDNSTAELIHACALFIVLDQSVGGRIWCAFRVMVGASYFPIAHFVLAIDT